MVIKWREREHEDIDNQVIDDPEALESLQGCSLKISLKQATCGLRKYCCRSS
jgi:hypothetical protein